MCLAWCGINPTATHTTAFIEDRFEDIVGFMGTTPPTHACAVRFMNFGAETKFEKGASDRNSPPGHGGLV